MEGTYVRRRRPQKARKVLREINQNILISHDKTKCGEYALDKPPKKPGGEEVDNINTAAPRTCDTSSKHEKTNWKMSKCQTLCEWKQKSVRARLNIYHGTSLWRMALVSHINVMILSHQKQL